MNNKLLVDLDIIKDCLDEVELLVRIDADPKVTLKHLRTLKSSVSSAVTKYSRSIHEI